MRLADALEHLVAGNLAAGDRAIGRHRQAAAAAGGQHLALVEERMNLDLVRHQRLARDLHRLLRQRRGEVRYPDMLGASVAPRLAENLEGFRQRHFRVGPVDQQQVDPRQLQLLQALIK